MKSIKTSSQSIGTEYPKTTGRLKKIIGSSTIPKKIGLMGDSTLDNGYWVEKGTPYCDKVYTVTHQTAVALANTQGLDSYDLANFAVDGATTADLLEDCPLNKVLPVDADHRNHCVHQLDALSLWKPDVVVISVGGNNYREALMGTLRSQLSYLQLLFRITPGGAKSMIREKFGAVQQTLLEEYKQIIDELINNNPQMTRIVLLSQYYPAITSFTPYFIYTGFSHLAHAQNTGLDPFSLVEETMNELYRDLLDYAATKNTEIVFADITSSLNPLGGNHTLQIEPNENGSKIMGKLITSAVEYSFPNDGLNNNEKSIAILRLETDEQHIHSQLVPQSQISHFKVKKIGQFIQENRYRHVKLLFSPSTRLNMRYENAFDLIMGKQFDTEYYGLFAFGVVDLSLITILTAYLWRVALNENVHFALRITAGIVAAPVLLSKMVLGLALMLVLALPIWVYDKVVSNYSELKPTQAQYTTERISKSCEEEQQDLDEDYVVTPT